MARRNGSTLEDLSLLPWQLSVALAPAVYIALKYVIPLFLERHYVNASPQETFQKGLYVYKAFATIAPVLAPFAAGILLLAAGLSAYNAWRKGNLLQRQTGIKTIRAISWQEFEELVGEAYRRKGYSVTECGGGGADGGVDLILKKGGEKLLVQCKHWRMDKVGVKVVRELYGVIAAEGASGGIVISSGAFTQEAKNFAKGKPLSLIDGVELAEIVAGVKKASMSSVEPVFPSKPVSPNILENAVHCPLCGKEMVLRTAKKGPKAGERFWGCPAFPKCRGTKIYEIQSS
jgi:restriction system protein